MLHLAANTLEGSGGSPADALWSPFHAPAAAFGGDSAPDCGMGLLLLRARAPSAERVGRAAAQPLAASLDWAVPLRFVDPCDAPSSAELFAFLAETLARVDAGPLLSLQALSEEDARKEMPLLECRPWPVFHAQADFPAASRSLQAAHALAGEWLAKASEALQAASDSPFFDWSFEAPARSPARFYGAQEARVFAAWQARAEGRELIERASGFPASSVAGAHWLKEPALSESAAEEPIGSPSAAKSRAFRPR